MAVNTHQSKLPAPGPVWSSRYGGLLSLQVVVTWMDICDFCCIYPFKNHFFLDHVAQVGLITSLSSHIQSGPLLALVNTMWVGVDSILLVKGRTQRDHVTPAEPITATS